jgi:hypothetical protein
MNIKLFALFLCTLPAFCQGQLSLTASTSNAKPGDTITLRVSYSAGDSAGLQWSLSQPWLPSSIVTGTAAAAGFKNVICNTAGSLCIVSGINVNTLPAGEEAVYTVTIPPTAAQGTYTWILSGVLGVTSSGGPLFVSAGAPVAVQVGATLPSKFDLNSDGLVNAADVNIALDQAIGKTTCGTADLNLDGKCNLLDIQAVILKVLGL